MKNSLQAGGSAAPQPRSGQQPPLRLIPQWPTRTPPWPTRTPLNPAAPPRRVNAPQYPALLLELPN
ncbi:hypothetical protein ACXM2N_09535 [Corynebacterium sp. ZY180755]